MAQQGKLPIRKPNRWQGYDYSLENHYFITICCQNKECQFGYIHNDKMILNPIGIIAEQQLVNLPIRFSFIELSIFQVMPNHVHAIISILEQQSNLDLSTIVGAYKSLVSVQALKFAKEKGVSINKLWQYSYFDHIIRNPQSYDKIVDYILNNPLRWKTDDLFVL